MIDAKKCYELYRTDAEFHAVVDVMREWIMRLQVSPSEVRAAAMFACYLTDIERPVPMPLAAPQPEQEGEDG
jgi:hypothetical protein